MLFDINTLLGSASAGLIGRIICHPLDTCKAQIQAAQQTSSLSVKSSTTSPYLNKFMDSSKSVFGVVRYIFKNEGIAGLYRGIGATLVGGIPATCLYLTSYDVSLMK
jgi:hypothetical protein